MFGSRQAIGIDFCEGVWRVVVLRATGGRHEVLYAGSLSTEESESQEETTALAWLLRDAGGARGRTVLSLPTADCAFKTANLPAGRPSEIEQVIRFEAENQFPLPLPELSWGYSLAPEPSGRRHAVIAGARRTLIEERLELCGPAGVTPTLVQPAALAAAQTVPRDEALCAIILVGAAWSDLCLYAGERLLSCRSIATVHPASPAWSEHIARELRPWIVTHDGLPQIILLGMASAPQARQLSSATGGIPVAVGNPWQEIADPRRILPAQEEAPAVFATAVGLALCGLGGRGSINLMPGEYHEAARQQRQQAWTLAGLALAISLLIPFGVAGFLSQQRRQVQVNVLQREITLCKDAPAAALLAIQDQLQAVQAHGSESDLRNLQDHLLRQQEKGSKPSLASTVTAPQPAVDAARAMLSSVQSIHGHPLDLLWVLSHQMPDGITLTDFNYVREKSVILQGHATSYTLVVSAISKLNDTGLFDNLMLNYANQANVTPQLNSGANPVTSQVVTGKVAPGYDFQITCTLPAGSDPTLGSGKPTHKTAQAKGTVTQ